MKNLKGKKPGENAEKQENKTLSKTRDQKMVQKVVQYI